MVGSCWALRDTLSSHVEEGVGEALGTTLAVIAASTALLTLNTVSSVVVESDWAALDTG